MQSEYFAERITPTDPLSLRVVQLRPGSEDIDMLMDFNDEIATFGQNLTAKVRELFPDEPGAVSKIPAYHVLIGSSITAKMDMNPSEEAKKFVEAEIEAFLDELESKRNG